MRTSSETAGASGLVSCMGHGIEGVGFFFLGWMEFYRVCRARTLSVSQGFVAFSVCCCGVMVYCWGFRVYNNLWTCGSCRGALGVQGIRVSVFTHRPQSSSFWGFIFRIL